MNTAVTKNIKLQKTSPEDTTNTIDIQRILLGRKKIKITHDGNHYTLQITGNNKLLLTK